MRHNNSDSTNKSLYEDQINVEKDWRLRPNSHIKFLLRQSNLSILLWIHCDWVRYAWTSVRLLEYAIGCRFNRQQVKHDFDIKIRSFKKDNWLFRWLRVCYVFRSERLAASGALLRIRAPIVWGQKSELGVHIKTKRKGPSVNGLKNT